MSWKRGSKSIEVELSRIQDWVEIADVDLNGQNGDKGMLDQYKEDRAFLKGAAWVFILLGGGSFLLQVLHALGWTK